MKNIINRNGTWLYFENEKIAQGKKNLIDILEKDQVLKNKIIKKIKEINDL